MLYLRFPKLLGKDYNSGLFALLRLWVVCDPGWSQLGKLEPAYALKLTDFSSLEEYDNFVRVAENDILYFLNYGNYNGGLGEWNREVRLNRNVIICALADAKRKLSHDTKKC